MQASAIENELIRTGQSTNLPLCVDLDGTLLRTDSLIEMGFAILKKKPWAAFQMLNWLRRGKAFFKQQIATISDVNIANLPRNEDFIAFLRNERGRGRRLILATGATRAVAEQINERLGLFDEIIATEAGSNLCGAAKRDRLVERFGRGGYAYAGNAGVDRCVWAAAGEAIVVNATSSVELKARREADVSLVFARKPAYSRVLLNAIRAHQWSKNILVFVPLIAAHQIFNLDAMQSALVLFIAFSLCASSGYIINDLLDLESDRADPAKRHRALASGDMPLQHGVLLVPALLLLAAACSLALPAMCQLLLAVYFAVSVLYSVHLKRKLLVDVYCLAGLYTLRVLAGGEACGIECSKWLLSFSAFLFISLAFLKRFSELHARKGEAVKARRGYLPEDTIGVAALGIGSGLVCGLVLALYISSPDVKRLYGASDLLWLVCPLLLYWISRVWLIAFRGRMTRDPVLFALTDRISYAVAGLTGVIIFGATLEPAVE